MSEDEKEATGEAGGPAVLAEQLDDRWELVAPGIYRLREDPGPSGSPGFLQGSTSEQPEQHAVTPRARSIFDEFEQAIEAALRIAASFETPTEI